MAGYHSFTTPKSQAKVSSMLAALRTKRQTRDELQCLLGVSKPTMRRYIEHLCAEKRIFIASWRGSTRGRFAPVYALGAGQDALEPAGMTKLERNQMEWKRIKADRDRHDRVKASARVCGKIKRVRGKPQPWFAALMGCRA